MASSPLVTSTSSLSSHCVVEKRYGGIPPQSSILLSERSPKRHAHHTNSDILNLVEAKKFLGVQNDADLLGDWQYGSRRTRSYTRLEQARTRRTARMFGTPESACRLPPPTDTTAPFTAYFRDEKYEGTSFASVPNDQRSTASPCAHTLCSRQYKEPKKDWAGKRLNFIRPRPAVRVRFSEPQPPCRLRLTLPRPPLKLVFPANVVFRNRVERLARAALQELQDREAQYIQLQNFRLTTPRASLHIRCDAHTVATVRAEDLAQETLPALVATGELVMQQAHYVPQHRHCELGLNQ